MLIAYCVHRYYSGIFAHPFGVRKKVSFITKKNCKVTKNMYLCMLE